MTKKLTIEELLSRFKKAHGDQYDYSEVVYVNQKTRVKIICPKHGPWYQFADDHIKNRGCKLCHPRDYSYLDKYKSGPLQAKKAKNFTRGEIIEKAKKKHGDKYNYSQIDRAKLNDIVSIICPEHGVFEQGLGVHFYGFGCKKCGYARIAAFRKVTFESFLIKANQVHSNKYQYENKNWNGVDSTFLNIICPIHGKFNQIAMSHVAGRGCPNCGKLKRAASKRQNVDILHQRLIECHDGYYNYDLSNFKSVNKYIDIICPKHGKFQQTPNNHLAGKGCYECGNKKIGDSLRSDPIDAINKFKAVHGTLYDYSLVSANYVNADTPVPIICKIHGEFKQIPYNHLEGKRCPSCKETNGEKQIREWLENNNINFTKEWRDHDCIDKQPLRFDFYLPENNMVIEFDGIQHFDPDSRWWEPDAKKREKAFELLKLHDWMKDIWCEENNIKMLRISYTQDVEKILNKIF